MKVHFKNGPFGMSGKIDDAIYYYHPKLQVCLMRPYRYPRLTANNERLKSIMQNLKRLTPSVGYKRDLADYIIAYNNRRGLQHKPMTTWNNAWLKLMFALQRSFPLSVDLMTITRLQILELELPCRTVKDSVISGLLPFVPGYEKWKHQI